MKTIHARHGSVRAGMESFRSLARWARGLDAKTFFPFVIRLGSA